MAAQPNDLTPQLGTVEASERLIRELYLDLRKRTRFWASITQQTAQARMGYVGQHLVSIVTGSRGGRSGARGFDLVHADGVPGEIKTCYRVDQLGKCGSCGVGVAPDDVVCPDCGASDIERKDDSKWLITFRHDGEFAAMLVPRAYYLVLFEFVDLQKPDTISASIWSVDPQNPGFILAMTDYYLNIRVNSASKAPFNLWPYSLKFELMRPELIYHALILPDDRIETNIFPGRNPSGPIRFSDFTKHGSAQVKPERWAAIWNGLKKAGADLEGPPKSKNALLKQLEDSRTSFPFDETLLIDLIAREFYRERVSTHLEVLPLAVRAAVEQIFAR